MPSESASVEASESTGTVMSLLSTSGATVWEYMEPYFAILGRKVRLTSVATKDSWENLALGDDSANRFFAVLLGYSVVGTLLALYMNIITVSSMQSAGRAVRAAVRQQLVVLKVRGLESFEGISFDLSIGGNLCSH